MTAADTVRYRVYSICEGQRGAIKPTHTVLTATLMMPTSGSIITVAPIVTKAPTTKTSATETQHQSSLPTTLLIDTSEAPVVPHPSKTATRHSQATTTLSHSQQTSFAVSTIPSSTIDYPTGTTTSSVSSASATETGASSADQGSQGEKSAAQLTKAQISGISIGAVGAAALVFLIFFFCYKRRRSDDYQSEKGFSQLKDNWGFGSENNRRRRRRSDGGGSCESSWIGPRIMSTPGPVPRPPSKSFAAAKSFLKPSNMAMAISPSSSNKTPQPSPRRPLSRLLPAKPNMPLQLNLPEDSPPFDKHFETYSYSVTAGGPSTSNHQTTITRPTMRAIDQTDVAAEPRQQPSPPRSIRRNSLKITIPNKKQMVTIPYGEPSAALTEFEEDDNEPLASPLGQIWKPPPSAGPNSSNTYYVADKNGNWVLGNPKRVSQAAEVVDPTPISSAPQSTVEEQRSGTVQPQPFKQLKGSMRKTYTSQPGSATLAPSDSQERYRSSSIYSTQPTPLISTNSMRRSSSTRNLTNRPRIQSCDSDITDIVVSPEDELEAPPLDGPGNLSPVAESPRSVKTRASPPIDQAQPVASGQQPPRQRTSRISNPPVTKHVYYPPGQPSPTLGLMLSPPGQPGMSSQNVPRRSQKSIQIVSPTTERTGSPSMRMVDPSPEPEDARKSLPSNQPPKEDENETQPQATSPTEQRVQVRPYPQDEPYGQPNNSAPRPWQQQQQRLSSHQRVSHNRISPYRYPPSQQPYFYPQQQQQQQQQRYPPRGSSNQPNPFTQNLASSFSPQQQQHHQQQSQWQYPQPQQYAQRYNPNSYQYPNPKMPPSQIPGSRYPPWQRPNLPHHGSGSSTSISTTSCSQSSGDSWRPTPNSLLAKRLGEDRASGMGIETQRKQQQQQNRASLSSSVQAGNRMRTETSGQQRDQASERNGPVVTPREQQAEWPENGDYWKPKLTPTKRGDDLFLSVQ